MNTHNQGQASILEILRNMTNHKDVMAVTAVIGHHGNPGRVQPQILWNEDQRNFLTTYYPTPMHHTLNHFRNLNHRPNI